MNQLYRALHMPPGRLLKKLTGSKEIYTIAVRRRAPEHPLPALGEGGYTPLPYDPTTWYADPLLCRWQGRRVLFCEAFDRATAKGRIAVFTFDENGLPCNPQTVLEEDYHLSFPTTFEWNGGLYMVPESGANHSVNLYRCEEFPGKWAKAAEFPVGKELCDAIVWAKGKGGVSLLLSETRPENQLYTRYCRYTLRHSKTGYTLDADDAYNANHLTFDLTSRNAGPLFGWGGQILHATQVSTPVDYGVYLQFFAVQPSGQRPLCATEPPRVAITGLDTRDIIGVHTYCCDDELEIIDARYLHRDPPEPKTPGTKPKALSTGVAATPTVEEATPAPPPPTGAEPPLKPEKGDAAPATPEAEPEAAAPPPPPPAAPAKPSKKARKKAPVTPAGDATPADFNRPIREKHKPC